MRRFFPLRVSLVVVPLALLAAAPEAQSCSREVVLNHLDAGTSAPRLRTPLGAPVLGGDFALRVEDAPAGQLGLLVFSAFEAPVPVPGLGALVWPELPWFTVPFATDALGDSALLLETPEVPLDLCDARATFQGLVLDPSVPGGVGVTNAVRLRVGGSSLPVFYAVERVLPATGVQVDVEAGDLDGDGRADLVTLEEDGFANSTVRAWLATPTGTFDLTATIPLPSTISNRRIALGHVDGDAFLDIVATDPLVGGVDVFLGDGGGGFGPRIASPVGSTPRGVAVGRLDGDAFADLLLASSSGQATVVRGDGAGAFGSPAHFATGGTAGRDAKLADLDGDGDLDAVVALQVGASVAVLPGDGLGGFGAAATYAGPPGAATLALGDFDGDGTPDVAVGGGAQLQVRLGNGDGTLGAPEPLGDAAPAGRLRAADLDGDGDDELVCARLSAVPGDLQVGLRDREAGGAWSTLTFWVDLDVTWIAAADFDADGRADVVAGRALARGTGNGRLAAPEAGLPGLPADVDGDGAVDLLAQQAAFALAVARGRGDGTFDAFAALPALHVEALRAAADVNGDGAVDLVIRGASLAGPEVVLGNGDGTFGAPLPVQVLPPNLLTEGADVLVRLADLNGDHVPDLTASRQTGTEHAFYVLLGHGDGTFGAPLAIPADVPLWDFADLDGDGDLDLVAAERTAGALAAQRVWFVPGNGDGTLGDAELVLDPGSVGRIALADLDADGRQDLLVFTGLAPAAVTLLGNGDGTFAAPVPASLADDVLPRPVVADLDGDAWPDLFSGTGSAVRIHRGLGDGTFELKHELTLPSGSAAAVFADFDGDGILDAVQRDLVLVNLLGE